MARNGVRERGGSRLMTLKAIVSSASFLQGKPNPRPAGSPPPPRLSPSRCDRPPSPSPAPTHGRSAPLRSAPTDSPPHRRRPPSPQILLPGTQRTPRAHSRPRRYRCQARELEQERGGRGGGVVRSGSVCSAPLRAEPAPRCTSTRSVSPSLSVRAPSKKTNAALTLSYSNKPAHPRLPPRPMPTNDPPLSERSVHPPALGHEKLGRRSGYRRPGSLR